MRSELVDAQHSCNAPNSQGNKASTISPLITNLVLFFIMLSGLLRSGGMLHLGRLLWKQGRW
jgi:hypothetical protein